MNNKKRIGIDARFYGPLGKGLGRYTQEMADNIIKLDTESEYVIFLRKENFNEFRSDAKNVKKVLADVRWYGLAEQILMPFYILREKLDLVHFPHFNVPVFCPVRSVITIHDLILTKFPTQRATTLGPSLYKIKNLAYKFVIWLGIKRAKRVLAVSQFTRDAIIEQFKIKPEKVVVIYEGVSDLASSFLAKADGEEADDEKILSAFNINNHFLLYVGNAYPHKNLEGLIDVFSEMAKNNANKLNLVLVGKEDYFYKRIKEYAKAEGDFTIFPGFVPDEKLKILFRNALAYVFPSFYEGFGLPPLEAMSKGCPVVSSNKTSMPEILGEAAIYFNPEDEKEMQAQIEKIINDKELRENLVKRGYLQAQKYSWQKAAQETLEVYKEVLR